MSNGGGANLVVRLEPEVFERVCELVVGVLTPDRWLSLLVAERIKSSVPVPRFPPRESSKRGKRLCGYARASLVSAIVCRAHEDGERNFLAPWLRCVVLEALAARTLPMETRGRLAVRVAAVQRPSCVTCGRPFLKRSKRTKVST